MFFVSALIVSIGRLFEHCASVQGKDSSGAGVVKQEGGGEEGVRREGGEAEEGARREEGEAGEGAPARDGTEVTGPADTKPQGEIPHDTLRDGHFSAGSVRDLENLEYALILFSKFKALKTLEFPKLALKSFEFVIMSIYRLRINICMCNYGINDVLKHVNIASNRINIVSVDVAICKCRGRVCVSFLRVC